MVTYLELNAEAVWRAQYVPVGLTSGLVQPLREHYKLGADLIGCPGDNNHLDGRHRSRNWDLQSRYCTNRAYGTTDARDQQGDGDWYRAIDIGITGQPLYDACRRLDAAVRAGRLPGVAEWFGTFDGQSVVGWYQGRPGSSDDSHLTHAHIGFWNGSANDEALMRQVFAVFTGTDMGDDDMWTATAPSGTIYLFPGDLVDSKPVAIPLTDFERAKALWANGVRSVKSSVEPAAPHFFVTAVNAAWPPAEPPVEVELSPEQLAEISEAARQGAAEGQRTDEQLVALVEQGANLAEDS